SRATSTPFVLDVPTSTPRTAFTPVAIWCHRSCHGLALERGVPRNCLILPCRGHLPVGSRSRSGHLVGALPAPCRTPARHDRSERVFATLSPSRFLSIGSGCAHEGDAAGGTATPNATEGTACSRALSTCSFCTGRPPPTTPTGCDRPRSPSVWASPAPPSRSSSPRRAASR